MFRGISSRRRAPSPALLIAVIALVLAIGGGAFASAQVGGPFANIAISKKTVRKIAKQVVKAQAPSLSVNHASTADSATNANHASTADSATVGGPVAFAAVQMNGTVVAAHSRGVTSADVTTSGSSSYCFKGLPAFTTAQVTISYDNTSDTTNTAAKVAYPDFPSASPLATDCPGDQLEVTTVQTAAFVRRNFYIAFFK